VQTAEDQLQVEGDVPAAEALQDPLDRGFVEAELLSDTEQLEELVGSGLVEGGPTTPRRGRSPPR